MPRLFVFGDSITKGVVFDEDRKRYHNLPENFLDRYGKLTGHQIINHSIFGATITKGKAMVERFLANISPDDEVLLMYGGNDCNFDWKEIALDPDEPHLANTPLEDFRNHYRQVIELVLTRTQHVALSTLPPLEHQRFFKFCSQGLNVDNILSFLGDKHHIYRWQEMYHMVVCELAAEWKLRLLDLRLPFLETANYQDYYCIDGMHPNQKGQELMLRAVMNNG